MKTSYKAIFDQLKEEKSIRDRNRNDRVLIVDGL